MKAAGKMVMESNSKIPPAEYAIGLEVMVRVNVAKELELKSAI